MCKKQLGRRNLTEEQRTMLIGKMYESRKKSLGASDGFRGNQHGNLVNLQNEDLPDRGRTIDKIAKELGVGSSTVERAEKFSKGIDALSAVNKEAAESLLIRLPIATIVQKTHIPSPSCLILGKKMCVFLIVRYRE